MGMYLIPDLTYMIPVSHRPLYIKQFKITAVIKSKQALAGLAFDTGESQIYLFLWPQTLVDSYGVAMIWEYISLQSLRPVPPLG